MASNFRTSRWSVPSWGLVTVKLRIHVVAPKVGGGGVEALADGAPDIKAGHISKAMATLLRLTPMTSPTFSIGLRRSQTQQALRSSVSALPFSR
jgi:hypothetical protein